jgi:aspartate/glutamate racemase
LKRATPQHIGIVACSAEGAAFCYRTICEEGERFLGPHGHPEVSMHTPSLAEYVKCFNCDDAVILGCTEIPLIINDSNSPLPTLNSTCLLARAALRRAAQDG